MKTIKKELLIFERGSSGCSVGNIKSLLFSSHSPIFKHTHTYAHIGFPFKSLFVFLPLLCTAASLFTNQLLLLEQFSIYLGVIYICDLAQI